MISLEEQARIDKNNFLQEIAKKEGMTLEQFLQEEIRLQQAWQEAGGWKGAKERLKLANFLLTKIKENNNGT